LYIDHTLQHLVGFMDDFKGAIGALLAALIVTAILDIYFFSQALR
jgi:hypothetical protein